MMDLVIFMMPPPQDTEQASWSQSETSQSEMKTSTPFILRSSPRIFSRAQISDFKSFCSWQQSFMVLPYSSFFFECCEDVKWDDNSDSTCSLVASAKSVCAWLRSLFKSEICFSMSSRSSSQDLVFFAMSSLSW